MMQKRVSLNQIWFLRCTSKLNTSMASYVGLLLVLSIRILMIISCVLHMQKGKKNWELYMYLKTPLIGATYFSCDVLVSKISTYLVVIICKIKVKPAYKSSHVTPYKLECSQWWKIYLSKKILYKICSLVWML